MGRWGWRLFEGDQDLDAACGLNDEFKENRDGLGLSAMIHQTDMLAPPPAREHYRTAEYNEQELPDIVRQIRTKLDTGLGDKLFEKYRAKEDEHELECGGRYRLVILGALMMRAGAKIKPDDLQHLRDLVPLIHCSETYALPMFDEGFRGPGKSQFLAALDNYQPGTPRNFQEPSCFSCGQIESDTGKKPLQCATCKSAWYCNKECQRHHWRHHKVACKRAVQSFMLNV